jgi:hypothetical protein
VRASRTRKQWDGLVTSPDSFSPRQPQDLVVGVLDQQAVPIPRPRQPNKFTIVASYVVVPAARGAFAIAVASSVGMTVGDLIQVMLDSGVPFQFILGSIAGNTLGWDPPLPGLPATVGTSYGDPIENAVVDLTSVGGT